jgi:guanine deaminase
MGRRRGGHRLAARHLLHLATSAGADALGLGDVVGDFSVGKEFDALWLSPEQGCTLDVALRHALSPEDALAKAFALAGPADVAGTWIGGAQVAGL